MTAEVHSASLAVNVADGRQTIPEEIVKTIDELEKASERYGFFARTGSPESGLWMRRVRFLRKELQEHVRAYGARMYNGGLELGTMQQQK